MYNQKLKGENVSLYDELLTFKVNKEKARNFINNIKPYKEYVIEVKEYRQSRSLNANGYFWLWCDKIADKIGSTKDEVYDHILKLHGPFIVYPCWEEILEKLLLNFKHYEIDNARYTKNGKSVCDIKVYKGSSDYNTKEMAVLIDDVLEECKLQGIDTITEEEKQSLINNWRG